MSSSRGPQAPPAPNAEGLLSASGAQILNTVAAWVTALAPVVAAVAGYYGMAGWVPFWASLAAAVAAFLTYWSSGVVGRHTAIRIADAAAIAATANVSVAMAHI